MLRATLAVTAAGLAVLSGCTSSPSAPPAPVASSPAPSYADTPATIALVAAALKTQSGSYHNDVTITSGSDTTLAISADISGSAVQLVMNAQEVKTTVRVVGTDMYVTGLPELNGKWVKEDISKLAGVQDVLDTFQQNFALLAGVHDVVENPPGTFTGTVDAQAALSKAGTEAAREALSKIISSGSAQIPFSAKVSGGYLVETAAQYKREDNGVLGDSTVVSKLSNFGKVAAIAAPPPADVVS